MWGLANGAQSIERAYESFFARFPQWTPEQVVPYPAESIAKSFDKKLAEGAVTKAGTLAKAITDRIGSDLLAQAEGRLLSVLNKNFEERHGGVIRSADDLRLHRFYRRPEIVRHFGAQYDPQLHNSGLLRFEKHIALITKLDTSGAKESHQYENRLVDDLHFEWTSQNRMSHKNEAGKAVVEHVKRGTVIMLFLQEHAHSEACFLGAVRYLSSKGDEPMRVKLALEHAAPKEFLKAE